MEPRDRLYLTSIVILAAGLAAAALIYLGADDSADPMEQILRSKMYARQLELYGGKASVIFDELMRWFDALWHGRKLAFTVGWLSALASGGVFLYALRGAGASSASSEDPASPPREDG